MLADVDEQREVVEAELRVSEDTAAEAERLRAARDSLAAYDPVHSTWFEDPDAVPPWEYLTHHQSGATTEEIRNAYRRLGARFEVVDAEGELTLRLELDLGAASLQPTSSS